MNDIKAKIMELGKKQIDLIPELELRGIKIHQSQLSLYLRGVGRGEKCRETLAAIREIIEMWEFEKEKGNGKR